MFRLAFDLPLGFDAWILAAPPPVVKNLHFGHLLFGRKLGDFCGTLQADLLCVDSLLKLGLAYQGLGERKAACNAYDELLTKYPKASKALRDRATAEKSRGKCS